MSEKVSISAMPTPNPNTIKFLPNIKLFDSGAVDFPTKEDAKGSILAEKLFEIEHVTGVMLGSVFVSVTKSESCGWDHLLESVRDTILTVLEQHTSYVSEAALELAQSSQKERSEIEQKIQEILDTEIRPAIALDGGDVSLLRFEDGVVVLKLQGACSGCPASSMTLKMGIENRLKEEFPGIVEEVIQEA